MLIRVWWFSQELIDHRAKDDLGMGLCSSSCAKIPLSYACVHWAYNRIEVKKTLEHLKLKFAVFKGFFLSAHLI